MYATMSFQDVPIWTKILHFFGVISWIVFLSGVASAQQSCDNADITALQYAVFPDCKTFYGYSWWAVFYQLGMMLILALLTVKDCVGEHRISFVGTLAPLTALTMSTSNTLLLLNSQSNFSSSEIRAAAAGAIMLSMYNLCIGYIVGLEDEGISLGKEFNPSAASPSNTQTATRRYELQ